MADPASMPRVSLASSTIPAEPSAPPPPPSSTLSPAPVSAPAAPIAAVDPAADLKSAERQIIGRAQQVWTTLQAQAGQLVPQLQAAADDAYVQFKSQLAGAKLSPEEADDVAWAFNTMAAVGVQSIGATAEQQAALNQKRLDALSVMADVAACKLNDGEKALTQLVAKVFALAQDFVLRGVSAAVSAAVGAAI